MRRPSLATLSAIAIAVSVAIVLPGLSAPLRTTKSVARSPARAPAVRRIARPVTQTLLEPTVEFGAPLPGLTAAQLTQFATGLSEFNNVEDAAAGLGPIFNDRSCVACHGRPAVGGGSGIRVTRFGRTVAGAFDPLDSLGGSLLQRLSIDPLVREVVPTEATIVAQRQSTPLFGLGLIEAIPDEAILYNAERQRSLGLNGVPSLVVDPVSGRTRIGRFGWKAQQATILAFSADAYLNEMGITNRVFPLENAPNGNATLLARFDRVLDPEDTPDPVSGKTDFEVAADFMRLLGPPPRLQYTPSALQGRESFSAIGCSGCHTPQMTTGLNDVQALNFKAVYLYSDLLLHDMGSLGDGIAQGTAGPRDMKTAPLWGLRASGPYLHDGRALTVDAAIQAHDGEAAPSRDRYRQLDATARQQLLEFLGSI
ncbi:MAG: di-heme oxidoredictase family protein [Pseudomonadota bacterium]